MRKFTILASAVLALAGGTPADAQTFQPAVVSTHLPPLEALWHVRVALNVAALACRDADEGQTVASYNALIRNRVTALAAANDAVSARYKAEYGARWETARERDMTRLYNYFAQPGAQGEFCTAAKVTLAQIATVDASELPSFAVAALPALEAPFWPSSAGKAYAAVPATPAMAMVASVPATPELPIR